MPHDANGALLAQGDEVTMRFRVEHIHNTADGCNVTLHAIGPMDEYLPTVSCNARLVGGPMRKCFLEDKVVYLPHRAYGLLIRARMGEPQYRIYRQELGKQYWEAVPISDADMIDVKDGDSYYAVPPATGA